MLRLRHEGGARRFKSVRGLRSIACSSGGISAVRRPSLVSQRPRLELGCALSVPSRHVGAVRVNRRRGCGFQREGYVLLVGRNCLRATRCPRSTTQSHLMAHNPAAHLSGRAALAKLPAFVQARLATAARAEIHSVWGLSRSPCSPIIPATRSATVSRTLAIRVKSRKYCLLAEMWSGRSGDPVRL